LTDRQELKTAILRRISLSFDLAFNLNFNYQFTFQAEDKNEPILKSGIVSNKSDIGFL
jgi:hypothetical protein